MPWNGSAPNKTFGRSDGTRTGTQVWQQAEADGVDIVSTDHDTHDQDLSSAINSTLLKDGGNTATGNLPMGTYRHTNVGDALALTQYQTLKQSIANGGMYVANVTGTADAIILTTTYTVPSLAAGYEFSFVVGSNNTGAATVVIDSNSAVAITRPDASALEAGDLYAGAIAIIRHDGTQFQLLNRRVVDGGSGGGDMTGAEIVSALNVELGSDAWQEAQIADSSLLYDDLDGRVVGIGQTNINGGHGEFTVRWTQDQRIIVSGEQSSLGYDAAGDNYGAFELEWNRDQNGTIENIYIGNGYILIQTDQTVGNLWSMGVNTVGQLGHGDTTSRVVPTRIDYFKTNSIKISQVWTEHAAATTDVAWFAIDTGGYAYSCGTATNYTMGNNSTTALTTPRKITQSDGTTALTGITDIAFSTIYAPVLALTDAGTLWRWGSGISGAHGNGSTADLTWPAILGGGTPTTGITKIAVCGALISASSRAVAAIVVNGLLKTAGTRTHGIGDGSALTTDQTSFADVSGTLASRTTVDVACGGGNFIVLMAIDSIGELWACGYGANNIYGAGAASSANITFTKPTLASSASSTVTITNASPAVITWTGHRLVVGEAVHFTTTGALPTGLTANTTYYVSVSSEDTFQVAATVGGTSINTSSAGSGTQTGYRNCLQVKSAGGGGFNTLYAKHGGDIYAIGSDTHYETGRNVVVGTAASRTWNRVYGGTYPILDWQINGSYNAFGLHVMCTNNTDRFCGYNASGQAGFLQGSVHAVPYLQPCQPSGPRVLKRLERKGTYSSGTTYSREDTVIHDGSTWRYINNTSAAGNALPTLPTTSNAYWELVAGGSPNASTASFAVDFDGLGATIAANSNGVQPVPFGCTITGVTLLADVSGSMVIDIQKDTYANYPPTSADSICSSTKPTLSSAIKYTDTTLASWTTTITAGDVLRFNVDSCTTITKAKLTLTLQKT